MLDSLNDIANHNTVVFLAAIASHVVEEVSDFVHAQRRAASVQRKQQLFLVNKVATLVADPAHGLFHSHHASCGLQNLLPDLFE